SIGFSEGWAILFYDQILAMTGPEMLCQTAANALGRAANGPKCVVANATPRPEFCIPTSIEIALRSLSLSPKKRAISYPNKSPIVLWRKTAINNNNPAEAIVSTFPETTAVTIIIMAMTDSKGTTLTLFSTQEGISRLTINLSTIGIISTWTIDINMERASSGIHSPANHNKSNGVITGARIVEKDVIVIERGRFPLAKYTMTFEAVPPGTEPSNTSPAANSAGKFIT